MLVKMHLKTRFNNKKLICVYFCSPCARFDVSENNFVTDLHPLPLILLESRRTLHNQVGPELQRCYRLLDSRVELCNWVIVDQHETCCVVKSAGVVGNCRLECFILQTNVARWDCRWIKHQPESHVGFENKTREPNCGLVSCINGRNLLAPNYRRNRIEC